MCGVRTCEGTKFCCLLCGAKRVKNILRITYFQMNAPSPLKVLRLNLLQRILFIFFFCYSHGSNAKKEEILQKRKGGDLYTFLIISNLDESQVVPILSLGTSQVVLILFR